MRCFRTYNLLISKRRSPTIYRLIPLLEVGNWYALKLTNMKADVRFCHLGIGRDFTLRDRLFYHKTNRNCCIPGVYHQHCYFLFGQWWEATGFWYYLGVSWAILIISSSTMSSCPIIWCGAWSLLRHGSRNSNQPPITVTMRWPQGMLEDIVVLVSAIGWKDSFFRDGHTSRSLDIFGHIFTQFSPWDPLWICAALMYPNTVKFSINSLENRWKKVQIHRISSEILPSSGSPSFTPSLDREV